MLAKKPSLECNHDPLMTSFSKTFNLNHVLLLGNSAYLREIQINFHQRSQIYVQWNYIINLMINIQYIIAIIARYVASYMHTSTTH